MARTLIDRDWLPPALLYGGNVSRAALAFLLNLLVARYLGAEQFGVFYFFLMAMVFTHSIMGEFMDTGVVHFYTRHLVARNGRTGFVIGAALALRLMVALPTLVLAFISAPSISEVLADDESYVLPIQAAVLVGMFASVQNLALAIFVARERFVLRSVLPPLLNMLRLPVVAALWLLGYLTLERLFVSEILVAGIFTVLCVILIRTDLMSARFSMSGLQELLSFTRWSALGQFSTQFMMLAPIPLLTYVWGAAAAGMYGVAATLTLIVEHATGAFVTVQFRRVSALRDSADLRRNLSATARTMGIVALLLLPLFFITEPLILLTYGEGFGDAIPVFDVLLVSVLINLVFMPVAVVFVGLNRPDRFGYTAFGGMLIWIPAALLLVGPYGAVGAGLAKVCAGVGQALLIVVLLRRTLREQSSMDNSAHKPAPESAGSPESGD